jgi:predicted permease
LTISFFERNIRSLTSDIRYIVRSLLRMPGYLTVAILSLALGLGATTAMLAVVDSVLLRPLDLPNTDRLESIQFLDSKGVPAPFVDRETFDSLRRDTKSFLAVNAYVSLPAPVKTAVASKVVVGISTTSNIADVSGVKPRLGRWFSDRDTGGSVAVISSRMWNDLFASDPAILGQLFELNGKPTTVIGVMPAGFSYPFSAEEEEVYFPVDMTGKNSTSSGSVLVVAMRKPSINESQAFEELRSLTSRMPVSDGIKKVPVLRPFLSTITGDEKTPLLALLTACSLLLLIGCANTANLQIARSMARRNEISLRVALGAGRERILALILTESLTVSLLGAAVGLTVALVAASYIRNVYSKQYPRFGEIYIHSSIFAACAALAIIAGLLAAAGPAIHAMRHMRGVSSRARVTRRSHLANALVVAELALTFILLISAGLLLRTFRSLEQVPLGFDPRELTLLTLMPSDSTQQPAVSAADYSSILSALEAMPGVQAATTETSVPFSDFSLRMNTSISLPGRTASTLDTADISLISQNYLKTMGIKIEAGRNLQMSDGAGSALVCLVNDAFKRRYWYDSTSMIGAPLKFISRNPSERLLQQSARIVGIIPDIMGNQEIGKAIEPKVYIDYRQFPATSGMATFFFGIAPQFAVRSTLPQGTLVPELRSALKRAAPKMAELRIIQARVAIDETLKTRQLSVQLTGTLGVIALVLATLGLYGVLSYSVILRTREIGVRMAVGATRIHTIGLILFQALSMCAFGLLVGVLALWPIARLLRAFLLGTSVSDPLTLASTALLLLCISALAAAGPATRAASIEPTEALRAE